MKYQVGDKVRIRSKEWYDKHKDANGEIRGAFFDKDRAKLCGTIQTIANGGFIDGLGVTIYAVEDAYEFIGEEAIEGLVEEEDKTVKTEVSLARYRNTYIPRISLYEAQKFLREEKGVVVLVHHLMTQEGDWEWEISYRYRSKGMYHSYEEALSEGIKGAVEILKEE